jgi:hypothetical protein
MMIHKEKCLELGLPEPQSYQNQQTYVLDIISRGIRLDTRMARYIGIHNLHSIAPLLKKKGYNFTIQHGTVKCPFTETVPSYAVDILSMSPEQIMLFNKERARQGVSK